MTKASTRKAATTKAPMKRAAAKTAKAPAKRTRTKATTEPDLTPVPDIEGEAATEEPEEPGITIDEETRRLLTDAGLTDDMVDAILPTLGGIHAHGVNLGRLQARNDVADDLRFLADARADYDQGSAPEPADMDDVMKAACIRAEAVAARWLAGIIDMSKTPAGWMPSWHWSEWQKRFADRGITITEP